MVWLRSHQRRTGAPLSSQQVHSCQSGVQPSCGSTASFLLHPCSVKLCASYGQYMCNDQFVDSVLFARGGESSPPDEGGADGSRGASIASSSSSSSAPHVREPHLCDPPRLRASTPPEGCDLQVWCQNLFFSKSHKHLHHRSHYTRRDSELTLSKSARHPLCSFPKRDAFAASQEPGTPVLRLPPSFGDPNPSWHARISFSRCLHSHALSKRGMFFPPSEARE
jgi:hypothetical protein